VNFTARAVRAACSPVNFTVCPRFLLLTNK
jgi:hypothetical protein